MDHQRWVTRIIVVCGNMLSLIGCFLPWVGIDFIPGTLMYAYVKAGFVVIVGVLAFFSSISTAFFQVVFMMRNRAYVGFLVFKTGVVTALCSGVWVLQPGIFEPGVALYTVLYGAYVTLIGALITLTGVILSLAIGLEDD